MEHVNGIGAAQRKAMDKTFQDGATGACNQCGREMSQLEIIVLGPVCGSCCKRNHKRVAGKR